MKVKIVIPMYKVSLSDLEQKSLTQIHKVLGHYPMAVIKPESLDLSELNNDFPSIIFESFDDTHFKDIVGYNQLMMSRTLYERFVDYDYILICQLDSYVFRDELLDFCNEGYDYVGAPWLKKKLYQNIIFTYFLDRKKRKYNKLDKPCRQNLYGKVGNGGFSLRRVQGFLDAIENHEDRRKFYLSHPNVPLYNEDVFWAIEIPEFKYPTIDRAISFAFDKYPHYCYKLNNNQLPFGCHGWYKRKWKSFWKPIIGF